MTIMGSGSRTLGITPLWLGLLLVMYVARDTTALDHHQMQRGSQQHDSSESASSMLEPSGDHEHGGKNSHLGPPQQRSRFSSHSRQDLKQYNESIADSKSKMAPNNNKPLGKNFKPTDCNISGQAFDMANKTHVESWEEVDYLLCQYYGPWSPWRRCNRRCQQRRVRTCRVAEQCGVTKLKEHRSCRRKRGRCSRLPGRQSPRQFRRQTHHIERVLYDALYTDWSPWGPCTRSCRQRRRRRCTVREVCQQNHIQESRRCGAPGTRCDRRSKQPPAGSETGGTDGVVTVASGTPSPVMVTTQKTSAGKKGPKPKRKPRKKKGKNDHTRDKGAGARARPEAGDDLLGSAQESCGIRPPAKRGSYRVVGGQEAQRLSWPWQVAILTRWEEQYCGGTLIAPQWLLTAAHCVRKRGRRRRIIVRAGEHNLEEYEDSEQHLEPAGDFPHPEFNYTTILNDIALVRLKTPPEERTHAGYACLPYPGFVPDRNSLCYIVGWGKKRHTHLFGAEVLHEAEVPLVSHRRCQKVFDYHINKTQVCAGYRRGGVDACAGDSGGPLLCPKTEKGVRRWFLVGVTSYGEGCGRRGKYGIYTRVSSYLDWIVNTILQN